MNEHGNVVGVVSAKLNVAAALATSGALAEKVNYAVKSSPLLSFLESMSDVAAKLKDSGPRTMAYPEYWNHQTRPRISGGVRAGTGDPSDRPILRVFQSFGRLKMTTTSLVPPPATSVSKAAPNSQP